MVLSVCHSLQIAALRYVFLLYSQLYSICYSMDVGTKHEGVGIIFQREDADRGLHLHVYHITTKGEQTLLFSGPLLHKNISLLFPSTKEISQEDFEDDKEEADEKVDYFHKMWKSYKLSGLVYSDNHDCHRTG